jgi:hypothetical protein
LASGRAGVCIIIASRCISLGISLGGRRHGGKGRSAGIHQFDGSGHDLGGLVVLGDAAQLLLPKIQVLLGQAIQIRGLRHVFLDPWSVPCPGRPVPAPGGHYSGGGPGGEHFIAVQHFTR